MLDTKLPPLSIVLSRISGTRIPEDESAIEAAGRESFTVWTEG